MKVKLFLQVLEYYGILCMSLMQDISTSLCFRGQRIFVHNASGWFGSVPLEASGDFGIHPEEGEFHLMCQVILTLKIVLGLGRCTLSSEIIFIIWEEIY